MFAQAETVCCPGASFAGTTCVLTLHRNNRAAIDEKAEPCEGTQPLRFDTEYPQNLWRQYLIILKKNFICYNRNPDYTAVSFLPKLSTNCWD